MTSVFLRCPSTDFGYKDNISAGKNAHNAGKMADKFSSQDFWATEACDSFIIMAYNFISLFRHAILG